MDQATLTARALNRAKDERLRVLKDKNRPGIYWVWSGKSTRERHTIVVTADREVCSCRGFYYRESCKHVEALRDRLARTGEREVFRVNTV